MKAHPQKPNEDSDGFSKFFPSPTGGSGKLRRNSAKRGNAQGQSSSKLIASCKQCGFKLNSNATASGGGSYDGNGGYGAVAKSTATGTLLNGGTFTDEWGDRSVAKGSGCPLCGSRHSV